ncbi:hypothetical protein QAD02_010358 [Eretmocerus hayati]|uniref:Uncharacterized protein n=1 Tax=Eretmocerus hayati TaxID=131215 RepID=A0ACC2NC00_9HYME|nr:hypothetical protein QAD02_010358 [Eretmocerus hayati]
MKRRKSCTLSRENQKPTDVGIRSLQLGQSPQSARLIPRRSTSCKLTSAQPSISGSSINLAAGRRRSRNGSARNLLKTVTTASSVVSTRSSRPDFLDSLDSLFDLVGRVDLEQWLVLPQKEPESEESLHKKQKERTFAGIELGEPHQIERPRSQLEALRAEAAEPHLEHFSPLVSPEQKTHETIEHEEKPRTDSFVRTIGDEPKGDSIENQGIAVTIPTTLDEVDELRRKSTPEFTSDGVEDRADSTEIGKDFDSLGKMSHATESAAASAAQSKATVCQDNTDRYQAPAHPLPPGCGEGAVVGDCQRRSSIMSACPVAEPCVATEMGKAQQRALCVRQEIQERKAIVQSIMEKEPLSEEDTMRLTELQTEIMEKIGELNDITRKLQRTFGLTDPSSLTFAKMFELLPSDHKGICSERQKSCESLDDECVPICENFAFPEVEYPEDKLPRVIICGNTEDEIPKIVVADSRPKSRGCQLTAKISESLCLQEKLAKENAQLEGGKYFLEKQLQEKDNAVECLQRKVCGLQAEMRMVVNENRELSCKLAGLQPQPQQCPTSARSSPRLQLDSPRACGCSGPARDSSCSPSRSPAGGCGTRRLAGGASKGCCPSPKPNRGGRSRPTSGRCGDIDDGLNNCGNKTKKIDEQISCLENEVSSLQSELARMKRERQDQQRKLFECPTTPKSHCPDGPKPSMPKFGFDSCPPRNDAMDAGCGNQQLRDLREQYARLQDDYKSKLCEVSKLRADAERLKRDSRDAKEERERIEIKLCDAIERMRVVEAERNDLLGCKEQLAEQEQAQIVARQRFREAQDELEELRTMIRDQAAQLDDYRSKYLQAQQQVEEQRRQLELMEMDNARMNENVTLEIGRVKNQFQEKLAELAPLPDILKQTQMKLQETQQLRMLAEHNCEDLSRELLGAKERIDTMQSQINDLQRQIESLQDEKNCGGGVVDELERKNSELRNDNERMRGALARLEEQHCGLQKRLDEKQHEVVQLTAMLEQVREDSARQVSRTKERCEAIKRSMQGQISDFEIQLAQCRAAAKTAQKERDEIRQKMQGQIGNLNEALQQAQGRIKSLQGHVDYLKVTYSDVFGQDQDNMPCNQPTESPMGGQGYDSCDCSY